MSLMPQNTTPLPSEWVQKPVAEVILQLEKTIDKTLLSSALQFDAPLLPSPVATIARPDWVQSGNFVGINVRTLGSFWKIIPYALTLPRCQSAIHLLPIWEPGVVDSLYGMASWRINPEFFSRELALAFPWLDTVEKQLKAVVNLLHAMGKTVGMDVIPHTDRYAEIVLSHPSFFEWLRRRDLKITDHSAQLHETVELCIFEWLIKRGPATGFGQLPAAARELFYEWDEARRLEVLFGFSNDQYGRNLRRGDLVSHLYAEGLEPVPATMGPPYRGIEVDPGDAAKTIDAEGRIWRDYRITRPQSMSRVFGPLTRYKLYEALDDNRDWGIDFDKPRYEVWQYVCEHYAQVAHLYGMDFMRGDMSHVQMRADGVPLHVGTYYDIHLAVKERIRQDKPWFGYFAESFLAAPGVMAYGDEVEHLEQSAADATLGDLQSMVVGSPEFMSHFRRYADIAQTRRVVPCMTMMTGDKDDPRFDKFYLACNEARMFTGLFLTDWPSYMALGFECRDPHPQPAPNEFYTKLYVFKIATGDKKTSGPYQWGNNKALFEGLTAIRQLADELLPNIEGSKTQWLLPPDPTAGVPLIAWTQSGDPKFIFVANLSDTLRQSAVKLPKDLLPELSRWRIRFALGALTTTGELLPESTFHYELPDFGPGGVLVLEKAIQ